MPAPHNTVIAHTQAWVERVVIGLNLCPFARAVRARQQIRYAVCDSADPERLLAMLSDELQQLAGADPAHHDTTLLIHPHALLDFAAFNQFQDVVETAVRNLDLEGVLQVASFHPRYQFANTEPDDITNATNRSPYPTLHLLREATIEHALATFPEPETIYEANLRTLQHLGAAGWAALQASCLADAGLAGPEP